MATAKLTVTPEELRAEAAKIQNNTVLYANAYHGIYRDADSLRAAGWWRGQAHDSFSAQINEFKKDFVSLERLLVDDFGRVLAAAGAEYQQVESRLVGEAGKLPTTSF